MTNFVLIITASCFTFKQLDNCKNQYQAGPRSAKCIHLYSYIFEFQITVDLNHCKTKFNLINKNPNVKKIGPC